MKFVFGIKPTIITGRGTTSNAKARIWESIRGCFCGSSKFGYAYVDAFGDNIKYVYGYNIEVFKRGKHHKDKHYVIYKYAFPIEMFKLLNVEITQGNKTFKITPKESNMIVCHCIKKYETDDAVIFEVGNEYYYHIDKQGDIWVYKHMSKYVDEMFESLEDFHKYFKDY